VEPGVGLDPASVGPEDLAAPDQHGLQFVQIREGPVRHRLVDEPPDPLDWVQFWPSGRPGDEVDSLGDDQSRRGGPPRASMKAGACA